MSSSFTFNIFSNLQSAICNLQPAIRPAVIGRAIALFIAAIFTLVYASAAPAELIDHIVAAVNNEVITASELRQAVALNERLGRASADRKALEDETLEGLINRRLLVQEARRLRFVDISDQELGAEVERLRMRLGSGAGFAGLLETLDMTEQELARMLGERLLAEKFVEKKVGLFVRVTHEEAESYFEEHREEFPDKRFPDVQKAITAFLTEHKIEQQLDQYVAELRDRADIRINTRQPG
jgi:hypothetical protein